MMRTILGTALLWLLAAVHFTNHATAQNGKLCSWSPDGVMLLFVARDGDRHFVARYDVATQSASRIFMARHGERIDTVQWCTDGRSFVAVTTLGIPPRVRHSGNTTIHRVGHPSGEIIQSVRPQPRIGKIWGEPIYQPDRLFVEAPGVVELVPGTGKMHALKAPDGELHSVLGTFGAGIGYLSIKHAAIGDWSIGSINPDDLSRTPYCDQRLIPNAKIQSLPAFAPLRERIALPAVVNQRRSILVFEHNRLLDTRDLDPEGNLSIEDVQWSPDSETIYVLGTRPLSRTKSQHVLIETDVHGDADRETKLFTSVQRFQWPKPRALSISSTGRDAAVVDGLYGDATSALYLIDLSRPERNITKPAFLRRTHLVLAGADRMGELAQHWLQTYQGKRRRYAEVLGPGSSAGFAQLLEGDADIALMLRPASEKELALAKKAGLQLTSTVARRIALAVCVHPDNPLTTIEHRQLTRLFRVHGEHLWSQLDVELPGAGKATDQKITMAMLLPGSRNYMPFRRAVLNNRTATMLPTTRESIRDLGKFVTDHANAIACLPFEEALRLGDAVRIVKVKTAAGPAIAPTAVTIADGSYPLLDTWFVAHNKNASARVRRFFDWIVSDQGKLATATFAREKAR